MGDCPRFPRGPDSGADRLKSGSISAAPWPGRATPRPGRPKRGHFKATRPKKTGTAARAGGLSDFPKLSANRGRSKSGFFENMGDCPRLPRAPIPGRIALRGARVPRLLGRVGRLRDPGARSAATARRPGPKNRHRGAREGLSDFPKSTEHRGRPKFGFFKNMGDCPRFPRGPDSGAGRLKSGSISAAPWPGSGDAATRAPEARPLQGDPAQKRTASRRARGSVRLPEDFRKSGSAEVRILQKYGRLPEDFRGAAIPGRATLRGGSVSAAHLAGSGDAAIRAPENAATSRRPGPKNRRRGAREDLSDFPKMSENRGRRKSGYFRNMGDWPRFPRGPDSGPRVALSAARFPRRLGRAGRRRDPGARNAATSRWPGPKNRHRGARVDLPDFLKISKIGVDRRPDSSKIEIELRKPRCRNSTQSNVRNHAAKTAQDRSPEILLSKQHKIELQKSCCQNSTKSNSRNHAVKTAQNRTPEIVLFWQHDFWSSILCCFDSMISGVRFCAVSTA